MFKKGFTLMELLIVVAIIGILAAVSLASLNAARAKSRDTTRIAELREMQKAVEAYYADHGSYPSTGSQYWGGAPGCYGGHGYDETGYIPGLVPDYMSVLPEDPTPDVGCYMYISNGRDYMIMAHITVETFNPNNGPLNRPCCNQPTIAVYSTGGSAW